MAKLTKNLAPLFDSSISYEPGERFMYGDHMYEALEPLSGAFDSTKVSEVTLADIFKGIASNDVKCLAPIYDESTEYYADNLVLYDGVLYECVETTTGPFDETKWSRKYLSDVGGLNSNLMKIKKQTYTPIDNTIQKVILDSTPKRFIVLIINNPSQAVTCGVIIFYNDEVIKKGGHVYNLSLHEDTMNFDESTNELSFLYSDYLDASRTIDIYYC